MEERMCSTPECDRTGKLVRGMCGRCYRYWLDHTPKEQRQVAPRFKREFWQFVEKSHEYGCWTWTGPRDRKGYGRWSRLLAHRHSWALANGPVPDGLWILHHCDNPPCVNPAHLYPGTVVENVRDSVARNRNYRPPLKDRCSEGHEIAGDNLRVVDTAQGVRRYCRICDNRRSRDRQRVIRRSRLAVPAPAGRIITRDVSARYGISRDTLFYWQSRGLAKSVKVGRDAWWLPTEIEAVLGRRQAA